MPFQSSQFCVSKTCATQKMGQFMCHIAYIWNCCKKKTKQSKTAPTAYDMIDAIANKRI